MYEANVCDLRMYAWDKKWEMCETIVHDQDCLRLEYGVRCMRQISVIKNVCPR